MALISLSLASALMYQIVLLVPFSQALLSWMRDVITERNLESEWADAEAGDEYPSAPSVAASTRYELIPRNLAKSSQWHSVTQAGGITR